MQHRNSVLAAVPCSKFRELLIKLRLLLAEELCLPIRYGIQKSDCYSFFLALNIFHSSRLSLCHCTVVSKNHKLSAWPRIFWTGGAGVLWHVRPSHNPLLCTSMLCEFVTVKWHQISLRTACLWNISSDVKIDVRNLEYPSKTGTKKIPQ